MVHILHSTSGPCAQSNEAIACAVASIVASVWLTKILDLIPSFPKVHRWSLWLALCYAFSLQLFPKVHIWSLWLALVTHLVPNLKMLRPLNLLAEN
ncbi:hypothetical protein Hanom_Chr10g00875381 [Helianthus anomalus]